MEEVKQEAVHAQSESDSGKSHSSWEKDDHEEIMQSIQ
jgi:hypothetical protein